MLNLFIEMLFIKRIPGDPILEDFRTPIARRLNLGLFEYRLFSLCLALGEFHRGLPSHASPFHFLPCRLNDAINEVLNCAFVSKVETCLLKK
jgi:hypothetical protein